MPADRHPSRRRFALRPLAAALALAVVATCAAPAVIRVRRGDTLSALALRYGTTVEALRALNHIGGNNVIYAGQNLRIGSVPLFVTVAYAKPVGPRRIDVTHVVRRGESLIKIARRYGVTPDAIAIRNSLPRSRVVQLGSTLVVPQVLAATQPAPAVRRGPRVSRTLVRQLLIGNARLAHVDPNLVLALAVQESGLQQHVVSSTGAIGVMQVMPGTGAWVGRYLLHRPVDLYQVEDNIAAGVRYLALLLRVAKSESEALAGYYQGLLAVRKRGMLPDTKHYVANILMLRRRLARG